MTMSDETNADARGVETRAAALRLIDAVLRRGQTLDVAMEPATRMLPQQQDRAFALAIASEVLRHLPDLDALIDSATAQPLPLDAKARTVLRIALVQLLTLGTAPHAAIATALPLVMGGPRRLVHGVFGTLSRWGATLPDPPTLPPAVAARWGADWGITMLSEAARAMAAPPLLDVTLRDPGDDAGLAGTSIAPGHRCLPRGTDVPSLPGYDDGKWWVQNPAAALPATLLGPGNDRAVLDLCAAPGGKTMQLAASGWRVTAVDSNARRLAVLRANLTRTQLSADIVEADLMSWEPPAPVDAILLDAPCTATGTFARHPDVLHRIGVKDITALSALQARMLARVSQWLTPGGRMVFATCSVERAEGEDVVAASTLSIEPVAADELPGWARPSVDGTVRIQPRPGLDGFFMARLVAR